MSCGCDFGVGFGTLAGDLGLKKTFGTGKAPGNQLSRLERFG